MTIMKKLYKQPQTETAELKPTTIICTSTGNGGSSENIGNGEDIELP